MENWSYTSNPLKPCLSLRNRSSTESSDLFHFETNGLFKARSFSSMSDSKSRQNVKDLDEKVNVDKLKPKQYYNTLTKSNEIGFEADELKKEFPDLVDDCSYSSVSINYNGLIPVLVKEVKDLKTRINELVTILSTRRVPKNFFRNVDCAWVPAEKSSKNRFLITKIGLLHNLTAFKLS